MSDGTLRGKVAVVGIGMSPVGKVPGRSPLWLAADAAKKALADSGLDKRDVDGVQDVAVVRRPDARWGEVPVVCVVRRDDNLTADVILASLRGRVANYKLPRDVVFVKRTDFRRGDNGKLDRGHLEQRAAARSADC